MFICIFGGGSGCTLLVLQKQVKKFYKKETSRDLSRTAQEFWSNVSLNIFGADRGTTDLDIYLDKLRTCLRKQCTVSLYWAAGDRFFELVPIYRDAYIC